MLFKVDVLCSFPAPYLYSWTKVAFHESCFKITFIYFTVLQPLISSSVWFNLLPLTQLSSECRQKSWATNRWSLCARSQSCVPNMTMLGKLALGEIIQIQNWAAGRPHRDYLYIHWWFETLAMIDLSIIAIYSHVNKTVFTGLYASLQKSTPFLLPWELRA